ncbi:MAG: hypothetical protein R3B06_19720 [Kofleriaceae bacterium]
MHRRHCLAFTLTAACAAGPTTGTTFDGTTAGAKESFYGFTDTKSSPVTAYVQTKPYCPAATGAFTAIGTATTAATATAGMNDARPAYYWTLLSSALSSAQWKQGGVARFKVRGLVNGSGTPSDLAGFTTDGPSCALTAIQAGTSWVVAGNTCRSPYPHDELITVASTTPAPADVNGPAIRYLGVRGGHYPGALATPDAGIASTQHYYASIGAPATLTAFKASYGFPAGEVRAVYYNQGDLGIGRDMHCTTKAVRGGTTTACYVSNYGRTNNGNHGPAGFGDTGVSPAEALDQIIVPAPVPLLSSHRPVATVAMVNDATRPVGDRVQFMVYDQNEVLTELAPLDNEGLSAVQPGNETTPSAANVAVPGNCLTCHGPSSSFSPVGFGPILVHGARFLPFDPDAFVFSTDHPGFARADMLPKLKQLNAMVWNTGTTAATQELLRGMYPSASNTGPLDATAPFDPTFVPAGWQVSAAARKVYAEVVKPYCRTCHVAHDSLDWRTYDQFSGAAPAIGYAVCNDNSGVPMPQAEQVQRRMWASGARAHLLAAFGLSGACTPIEPVPASPGCP